MSIFVLFVFAAVIIGAGTMLAPALPTQQPRVGLASTIALAFVLTGGILWTRFLGWDTLVIDYLLFGIVSLVVLGGTMVQAHQKATGALDETESEPDIDWMSRNDFILFLVIGLICLIPLFFPGQLAINSPAIAYGQRLSEIETTYPQIQTFGATGFYVLTNYLSQQLQQNSALVYPAVGSVLAFLCILTTYDFGAELKNTALGRILAILMLIALSVTYVTVADFYSLLIGVLFILALLIFALRTVKHRHWQDIVGMILLASVILIS